MKLDLSILDGSRLSNSTRAEAGLPQEVSAEGLAQQFPLPAVKDVSSVHCFSTGPASTCWHIWHSS
jgi:hypothetical protein